MYKINIQIKPDTTLVLMTKKERFLDLILEEFKDFRFCVKRGYVIGKLISNCDSETESKPQSSSVIGTIIKTEERLFEIIPQIKRRLEYASFN